MHALGPTHGPRLNPVQAGLSTPPKLAPICGCLYLLDCLERVVLHVRDPRSESSLCELQSAAQSERGNVLRRGSRIQDSLQSSVIKGLSSGAFEETEAVAGAGLEAQHFD